MKVLFSLNNSTISIKKKIREFKCFLYSVGNNLNKKNSTVAIFEKFQYIRTPYIQCHGTNTGTNSSVIWV